MEIKLFEEYSQDKFGIIQDTFESIFDFDPSIKIEVFNVVENIIHLIEPVEYGYKNRIFYRYKCDQKESIWDVHHDGYCYTDGNGILLNNFTIDSLKTRINKIEENPYYLIEISNLGDLPKSWGKIYPSIQEGVEILKSYDIDIHNCGDLFFRNGIENLLDNDKWEIIEQNWGKNQRQSSLYDIGKYPQINICLKSY
jgi:hypothetical protein